MLDTDITEEKIMQVQEDLVEAGEDLADYPRKRIVTMIEEGYLDD